MFKNGAECITGIIAFQDIVMGAEVQQCKKYVGENSVVPGQQTIPSHTAEVSRQVEGAHIPPNGWVGGDAWFGSVSTAIEVFKKFNVHSTWIIKKQYLSISNGDPTFHLASKISQTCRSLGCIEINSAGCLIIGVCLCMEPLQNILFYDNYW